MNDNEIELLKLIRDNDDPGRAMLIATQVILEYLAQHGSSEGQAAGGLSGSI